MAIVIPNSAIITIRGRVGDIVFKTYRDKIVATRVPRFDGVVASPAQRARRERLKEATAFAKRVYADPRAKAAYVAAARRLGRQPFRLAVSDYLRASDTDLIDPAKRIARWGSAGRLPSALPLGCRRRTNAHAPKVGRSSAKERSSDRRETPRSPLRRVIAEFMLIGRVGTSAAGRLTTPERLFQRSSATVGEEARFASPVSAIGGLACKPARRARSWLIESGFT